MDPTQRGSHSLTHLGRIEVMAGPHIFAETKLFEMKREPIRQSIATISSGSAKKKKLSPVKPKKQKPLATAVAAAATTTTVEPAAKALVTEETSRQLSPAMTTLLSSAATPGKAPLAGAAASQTPAASVASPRSPSFSSPRRPSAAATAAVDPMLVTRVNARAAQSQELRDLLVVAARGVASPEQLRILGGVIQEVTREMEADGLKVQSIGSSSAPRAAPPLPPPGPPPATVSGPTGTAASTPVKASVSTPAKVSPKSKSKAKPKGKGRAGQGTSGSDNNDSSKQSAKCGGGRKAFQDDCNRPDDETATAIQSKASDADIDQPIATAHNASKEAEAIAMPPPPLSRPIFIVEFRESSSIRYYLPVWTSIATRRKFVLPVTEDNVPEELTEELVARNSSQQIQLELEFVAPLTNSDSGIKPGSQRPITQDDDAATTRWPMRLILRGVDPHGLIWEAFGRLPAVKTLDDYGVEIADSREKEGCMVEEATKAAITEAVRALAPPVQLDLSGATPPGLEEHLTDRYAPQRKRGSGSSVDAQCLRVDKRKAGRERARDSLPFANAFNSSFDASVDDVTLDTSLIGVATKPRKKRNVATHNPDGSIKRFLACHTTTTPMWRRGPEGPGTLCNACGARWKVGRLDAGGRRVAGSEGNGDRGGKDGDQQGDRYCDGVGEGGRHGAAGLVAEEVASLSVSGGVEGVRSSGGGSDDF